LLALLGDKSSLTVVRGRCIIQMSEGRFEHSLGPQLEPLYIAHRHKEMRSSEYAAPRQDADAGQG
jgi:hypothetical protein